MRILLSFLWLADTPGLSSQVWKKAGPGHVEASRRVQPLGASCFPAERCFQTVLGSWASGEAGTRMRTHA